MAKYELTEEQKLFLQRFITGKGWNQKRKISNAYTDYCRRESKVLTEVEKLDPSSEDFRLIGEGLEEARQLADRGDFKAAYNRLDAVKKSARLVAKGVTNLVATIDTGDVILQIQSLEVSLDACWTTGDSVRKESQELRDAPEGILKKGNQAEIMKEATRLRLLIPSLQGRAAHLENELTQIDAPERIAKIAKTIDSLERAGTNQQKGMVELLRSELNDLEIRNRLGGQDLWAIDFQAIVAPGAKAIQDWWDRDFFADIPTGRDNLTALPNEALVRLKEREEARMNWVAKQFKAAAERDKVLAPPNPNDPLEDREGKKPVELRRFAIGDLDLELTDEMGEEQLQEQVRKAGEKLDELLKKEAENNPNSDVIFDLLMKSPDDFKTMIGKELAWATDQRTWSEQQTKQATSLAEALHQQLLASAPNKMSEDGGEVTVGGKTYKKEQKLGEGSFGDVFRFVDEEGNKVVIKSLKRPEKRQEMVTELEMHRRAMGGENGEPHPNIVPLRGIALDPNGALMMLMDEADGGDADQLSLSMLAAMGSGALPKEARDALARNTFLQMVAGMKHVHDVNLTHNDIKGGNFLVKSDGTVQVADFGSGRQTDDEGILPWYETEKGEKERIKKLHQVEEQIQLITQQLNEAEEDGEKGESSEGEKTPLSEGEKEKLQEQLLKLTGDAETLGKPGPDAYKLLPSSTFRFESPSSLEGGKVESTQAFAPMEGNLPGVHSQKFDVFMLGTTLDLLTKDFHTAEVLDGGLIGTTYGLVSRQTGHGVTSLDRLRNGMLEPDPSKRPSLDSVLGCAYLEKSDSVLDDLEKGGTDHEENLQRLQKAVTKYGTVAGKRIGPLQAKLNESVFKVQKARRTIEQTKNKLVTAEKDLQEASEAIELTQSKIETLEAAIEQEKKNQSGKLDVIVAEQELEALKKELAQGEKQRRESDTIVKRFKPNVAQNVKALMVLEKKEAETQRELRSQIEEINQEQDVAEALKEIAEASKPFGTPSLQMAA